MELAMTGPAELVTCDQTIERAITRLKQHRAIASRYDTQSMMAAVRVGSSV
jgi:hypothetical protein